MRKKILLGVTGGISAYKSVELLRILKKMGADVSVMMTASAREFVGPVTFEVLSGHPVHTELFPKPPSPQIPHIALGQWADLMLIAPATANTIGKIAAGLADDLLSATVLASPVPILLAPAMETNMVQNPIVKENVSRLRGLGYLTVGPGEGFLASGTEGMGRMSEPEEIAEAVLEALNHPPSAALKGCRILVTAGRTEEDIDPVRFLTNRSSGKMGFAIAERARRRGADVTLISGPTHIAPPEGVRVVNIRTVDQMRGAVEKAFPETDVLIMAAAVLDFRTKTISSSKIKKSGAGISLELVPTEDFLVELGKKKRDKIVVGFAMETENGLANATNKLRQKNMDLIVMNDLTVEGAGFQADTNVVSLIDEDESVQNLQKMTKLEVADHILDRVTKKLKGS